MPPRFPLTARVLSRHVRAAVVFRDVPYETVDLTCSNGSTVTPGDVARILRARFGIVSEVRFRAPSAGDAGLPFEADTAVGPIVTGSVVVHTDIREGRIVCWAEVVIEE